MASVAPEVTTTSVGGVEFQAVEAAVGGGDGFAQLGQAGERGVLVAAVEQGVCGGG